MWRKYLTFHGLSRHFGTTSNSAYERLNTTLHVDEFGITVLQNRLQKQRNDFSCLARTVKLSVLRLCGDCDENVDCSEPHRLGRDGRTKLYFNFYSLQTFFLKCMMKNKSNSKTYQVFCIVHTYSPSVRVVERALGTAEICTPCTKFNQFQVVFF